jgi:hypothetical protein
VQERRVVALSANIASSKQCASCVKKKISMCVEETDVSDETRQGEANATHRKYRWAHFML